MSTRSTRANASGGRRSPKITYTIVALAASALGALVLWLWVRWDVYWLWLLSINVIAFLFYRYDKMQSRARRRSRVPEVTLLTLTLAGGVAGAALGMYMPEQHKVNKSKFVVALLAGAAIQAVLIYFLYVR